MGAYREYCPLEDTMRVKATRPGTKKNDAKVLKKPLGASVARVPEPHANAESVLALQRASGNRSVQEALSRARTRPIREERGRGAHLDEDEATSTLQQSTSIGVPLPKEQQTKFERSLSVDLSGVRVHADDASAAKASALGARAFALGRDIYFARGEWHPSSTAGEALLAHEVAHTVQQAKVKSTTQAKLEVSSTGDAHEIEAERAATAMVRGVPTAVSARPSVIARKEGTVFVSTPGGGVAEERHGTVKEIDEMRARLVEAFRALIPQMSNREMIQEALRLDEKLWRPEIEVGLREKAAIARTLIEMYHTLDERIQSAPWGANRLPIVEGIQWQKDDPLAGNLLAINPFGNVDLWSTFSAPVESAGLAKRPIPRPRKKASKLEHIEFEDEMIVVPTPEKLIKRAIKAVQASDERWKDRELRMLDLLADPSVDDEVLIINEYLSLNKGFASLAIEPSKVTLHARQELARWLNRASTDEAAVVQVRLMVDLIHQGYYWAQQVQMKYSMGGGSSASAVERAAYDWISGKQNNPRSVYSAWVD
jgi:hypothetical protein